MTLERDSERPVTAIRTFLFVDIRGYTRFTVEHGDAEAYRLVERFDKLARKVIAASHGEVAGKAGDELVAVFGSAREAIMAAAELQVSFAAEAKANPMLLPVGIGLDAGEAIPAGDTFVGTALNLAARLCKLAGPQEVLASESVVHIAGKLDGIAYAERGFMQLKGFGEPVRVFQVQDGRMITVPAKFPSKEPYREAESVRLPIGAYLGALPSSVLVAREQELNRLLVAADDVQTGNGRLVMIAGEPGVGKTRLAQEVMLNARNRRFLVAAGRCYEQQKSVPFYPFIDILLSLYNSSPETVRAEVAGRWSFLYRLLPEISPESIPVMANSPDELQRLFRAVSGFLQAIASDVPVAIFLDDLHWADDSTLDLFQHLVRSLRTSRLLVVATYREAEVAPNHPLEAALRDLSREELAETIHLPRLEPEETSKLIATTLGGRSVPSDFAEVVQRRAEGNPFFTQQLVRFLVERGDVYKRDGQWIQGSGIEVAIPDTVRSVIGQRMARLSEKTQERLAEASVLGQTFRFDVLRKLSGVGESEIEAALQDASAAGLVTETRARGYTFDHVLTQEALYTGLNTHRRGRLHLAAAEAMEALPEDERSGLGSEISWHFLEAGQDERAEPFAISAGIHAATVFAYQEADRQFTVALDISRRLHDASGEIAALIPRAKLRQDMFKGKDAASDYERLLEIAQNEGDRSLELTARLGLSRAYYVVALDENDGDSISKCRAMSESAYDLARRSNDKKAMVQSLMSTKYFPDFWPDYRDRWLENAKQAIALSRETGDPELVLEAELVSWHEGPKREAAERGETLARKLKDRKDLFRLNGLYFSLMWKQLDWGEYESSSRTCDAAIRLANEIGVLPVQYPTLKAMALLQLGRYGEAWESLQGEVADSAHPFGQAMQTLGMAEYFWEIQDFDEASAACRDLQRRAASLRRAWMIRWAAGLHARTLARRGELTGLSRDEIKKEVERFQGRVPREVLAETLLAEGKAEEALNEARAFAEEARSTEHVTDLLLAFELQARALVYLGRLSDVDILTEEACRLATEHGNLSIGWRLLELRGRTLQTLKDKESSGKAFKEAASIVHRIGNTIPDPHRPKFFASDLVVSVLKESQ